MKKLFSLILAFTMILCLTPSTFASVSGTENRDFKVRVNGYIVDFPDAQPYIDSNSRTLVPVRFVAEQLGAKVDWNQETMTATIEKNGISVDVTINSPELRVTQDKETTTSVKMDTAAVIKDNRTYVPIRFVAEALGAYVDYSDYWRTVGIYQDVLTRDNIKKYRAYDYTTRTDNESLTYKSDKKNSSEKEWAIWGKYWGNDREEFSSSYETAHEHLYQMFSAANPIYSFPSINVTLSDPSADEFFDTLVQEARNSLNIDNERLTLQFITDSSCIYQPDEQGSYVAVRGTLVLQLHTAFSNLTPDERDLIGYRLWLARITDESFGSYSYEWDDEEIPIDKELYADYDIFMKAYPSEISPIRLVSARLLDGWYYYDD